MLRQLGGSALRLSPSVSAMTMSACSAPALRMMSSSVPLPRTVSPLKADGSRLNARALMSMTVTFSPR